MQQFLNIKQAADYCGVEHTLLKSAVEYNALSYFRPTPRKVLFQARDLDTWMASFKRVVPQKATAA
jgi:hypothetical protein